MAAKTIRVFEQTSLRVGEPHDAVEEIKATLTGQQFNALVRFNDAGHGRFFEIGHKRVRFLQFVGFLQVGSLGIEILPKADRAATSSGDKVRWHNGLLQMLEIATEMRLFSPSDAAQRTAKASLLELIASRFIDATERLVREGLGKGYREEEANHSTFRGKLLFGEHVRENASRADRFYVRHSTYDHDTLPNRILASALDALDHLPLPDRVTSRAASCHAAFADTPRLKASFDVFDRLPKSRGFSRYHEALSLARLILERHAPKLNAGSSSVFALLFDMNLLWERFIAVLFRRAAPRDLIVSTQEGIGFWAPMGAPPRRVRPDIVVRRREGNNVLLIADTKWRAPTGGSPSDDELKQMFVYNELFQAKQAFLLYPSEDPHVGGISGRYLQRGHSCEVKRLGLFSSEKFSASQIKDEIAGLLRALSPAAVRETDNAP